MNAAVSQNVVPAWCAEIVLSLPIPIGIVPQHEGPTAWQERIERPVGSIQSLSVVQCRSSEVGASSGRPANRSSTGSHSSPGSRSSVASQAWFQAMRHLPMISIVAPLMSGDSILLILWSRTVPIRSS